MGAIHSSSIVSSIRSIKFLIVVMAARRVAWRLAVAMKCSWARTKPLVNEFVAPGSSPTAASTRRATSITTS